MGQTIDWIQGLGAACVFVCVIITPLPCMNIDKSNSDDSQRYMFYKHTHALPHTHTHTQTHTHTHTHTPTHTHTFTPLLPVTIAR